MKRGRPLGSGRNFKATAGEKFRDPPARAALPGKSLLLRQKATCLGCLFTFCFELERRERNLPRSSCGRCARRCSKAPLSLLRINISSFCPPKFLLSVYHIIGKKSIKQNLFPLIFLPIAAVLISPQHLPT